MIHPAPQRDARPARPAVRLGLVMALGLFGVWLAPGRVLWFPAPFAGSSAALAAWTAAALAAALLLRRLEPRPAPSGGRAAVRLARRLAAALAAPLVLYAARPAGGAGSCHSMRTLSRAAFAAFPFLFALPALLFWNAFWLHGPRHIELLAVAIPAWTWLAATFLALVIPPPDPPRWPALGLRDDNARAGVCFAAAPAALGTLALLASGTGRCVGIIVAGAILFLFAAVLWLPGPLLLLLGHAPADPDRPTAPQPARSGPGRIAAALLILLAFLSAFALSSVRTIAAGRLFDRYFAPYNAGFSLDQPTIGKYVLWETILTVIVLLALSAARAQADRRTRAGAWTFALLATLLGLGLLAMHLDTLGMLGSYIHTMGWTPRRVAGLVHGFGCLTLIAIFLVRALRPPEKYGDVLDNILHGNMF